MAEHTDVQRRDKRSSKRAKRKPMTPAKAWPVVGGLFLILSVLPAVLWLRGADFSAEYRPRPLFSTADLWGGESCGTRLSVCGFVRTLTPDSIDEAIPCVWWNLGAVYIISLIGLAYAIKLTLFRR